MRHKKSNTCILGVLALVFLANPAWAESRSHAVNVSCSIAPDIALVPTALPVQTNLSKEYTMSEASRNVGGRIFRVYTITAL